MTELRVSSKADLQSVEAETERIMRTATVWVGVVAISAALLLGPSVAAGWRPEQLPLAFDAAWWLGALASSLGIALLVWAGCPVLGYELEQAHRQKVFSVRVGIVLGLSGIVFAGLAVLVAPPV